MRHNNGIVFSYQGNGTIEYDEFVKMMSKRSEEVNEEDELRKSFKVFDKNGEYSTTNVLFIFFLLISCLNPWMIDHSMYMYFMMRLENMH